MAAKRCLQCGIDYPTYSAHDTCGACGEDTTKDWSMDFDPNWAELMAKAKLAYSPLSVERLAAMYPHDPDASVSIHRRNGREFVVHQDLLDVGYLYLEDFSIVYLNGQFYELQGHGPSYRLIGEYHPSGCWWIESISISCPDHLPQKENA